QTLLEDRLRRAYEEAGGRIAWSTPVTGVDPWPDGVRVRVAGGGETRAAHVIAADGPRSAVRRSLGTPLTGTTSGTDFVVVDVADAARPLPPERVFHYRHPGVGGRNVLLVPFRGGWRVDLQCADEKEAADFADDTAGWVAGVLPGHEVTWVSRYRFHQRVAERFVDDHHRVLLAGEAAHLFPPFGARGMNSGIVDAVAAVDAVADGDVGSYDRDRRAAAWQNCRAAGAACAHLLARTRADRLRQRGAALLAPFWEPAGRWLDSAPFGPPLRKVRY
ncbi:FAD-dependent monooxygenase, partial [Thermobifida halotolerans]